MRLKMLVSNGLMMQSVYEALLMIPYVQEYSKACGGWMENGNPEEKDQVPGLTDNPDIDQKELHAYRCVTSLMETCNITIELVETLDITKRDLQNPEHTHRLISLPCTLVKEASLSNPASFFLADYVTVSQEPMLFEKSYQGSCGNQLTTLFVVSEKDPAHRKEHVDEQMIMLETNIDDCTGEMMGYTLEVLLNNGASDVYFTPIIMKKNRPSYKLSVLASSDQTEKLESLLFEETSSLGVRSYPVSCHRLGRKVINVETEWGAVSIKLGIHKNKVIQVSPEFEDCRLLADKNGIPFKRVYEQAKKMALDMI
ncbi:LarC family nickel insertion protein [Bacillus sp. Marseille-Q3570]|uniref:LarC family nickel insertion protein n=1 Tax=Bacillus sp. Marseille-Q3570 TaxID=2963522 RepID=UPI0021B7C13F|nr:LarC family nickel insertion protein [Bacillus sp. Marseille-Q3570]